MIGFFNELKVILFSLDLIYVQTCHSAMNIMKKISTLIIVFFALMSVQKGFSQTVYASLGSGAWNSGTEWETYSTLAAALAARLTFNVALCVGRIQLF